MRKILLAGSVLIVAVLIGAGIYYYKMQQNSTQTLTFYGNVDIREVDLSFRVSGRIQNMRFEEGNHVNRGEVLAVLDKDTYQEDLAMAKSMYKEAVAAEQNAQRIFKRRTRLISTGAVSQAQFDDSKAALEESLARTQTALVRIAQAETALEDTQILAPTSGTILTRVREPGAIVNVAQTVYTLTVDNPVWVRAFVDEPKLGDIYPGQKALVYTDSRPGKPYKGHIGYIASQAEFTPKTVETTELRTDLVYRFRIVVDNPDNGLRQGMPVTIKIIEADERNKQG